MTGTIFKLSNMRKKTTCKKNYSLRDNRFGAFGSFVVVVCLFCNALCSEQVNWAVASKCKIKSNRKPTRLFHDAKWQCNCNKIINYRALCELIALYHDEVRWVWNNFDATFLAHELFFFSFIESNSKDNIIPRSILRSIELVLQLCWDIHCNLPNSFLVTRSRKWKGWRRLEIGTNNSYSFVQRRPIASIANRSSELISVSQMSHLRRTIGSCHWSFKIDGTFFQIASFQRLENGITGTATIKSNIDALATSNHVSPEQKLRSEFHFQSPSECQQFW